jgi:hypothetical protein
MRIFYPRRAESRPRGCLDLCQRPAETYLTLITARRSDSNFESAYLADTPRGIRPGPIHNRRQCQRWNSQACQGTHTGTSGRRSTRSLIAVKNHGRSRDGRSARVATGLRGPPRIPRPPWPALSKVPVSPSPRIAFANPPLDKVISNSRRPYPSPSTPLKAVIAIKQTAVRDVLTAF